MDSILLARTTMVGWLFLAVFLGSLWRADGDAWHQLLGFLREKDSNALAVGILGALVGISAPPALGFLLERVVTLILTVANRSIAVYPEVKSFKESLANAPRSPSAIPEELSGDSVFHVYFHTYAHANLQTWSRRRIAQVYASATGALAVLGGLGAGIIATRSVAWGFFLLCLFFVAVLFNDARLQSNAHQAGIRAWIQTLDLTRTPPKDNGP